MIETLVLAVCVSGAGCTEATSAYYSYNRELQVWTSHKQQQLNDKIGAFNLSAIGTAAGVVFVKQGALPINRNLDLLIGSNNEIQLHWEY